MFHLPHRTAAGHWSGRQDPILHLCVPEELRDEPLGLCVRLCKLVSNKSTQDMEEPNNFTVDIKGVTKVTG